MSATAKQVSARARARAASSKFYEQERLREAVTSRYFDAMDAVARVFEVRDKAIERAHAHAQAQAADAVAAADGAIRQLAELGVSRPEIAERLGCTAAEVRRALTPVDDSDSGDAERPDPEIGDGGSAGDQHEPAEDSRDEETSRDASPAYADEDSFAGAGV